MTLSKKDILNTIASEITDVPKAKVDSIIKSVFEIIKKEVMENDNDILIQKFGKFEKKTTNIKKGLDMVKNKMVVVRKNESLKFTGSKK